MFAEKLKYYRNKKGLSQKKLAELLFVSQQAVAKWEIGTASPNPETLKKIADILEISTTDLLGGTEPHTQADELDEFLDELHKRPELRLLFDKTKHATKDDINKVLDIIEIMKKGR